MGSVKFRAVGLPGPPRGGRSGRLWRGGLLAGRGGAGEGGGPGPPGGGTRHPPPRGGGHDQARVGSPAAAFAAGADVLVVGRAVTAATDPEAAAVELTATLRDAL